HRIPLAAKPGLISDFEPSPFRDALERVVEIRRLLPVLRLDGRYRELRVLDANEKTVARLRLESLVAHNPGERSPASPRERISVRPVRGYDAEFDRLRAFLDARSELAAVDETELEQGLAWIGVHARDYTSKLQLHLDASVPASDALRTILVGLLDTIVRNEEGTRRNVDPEFLHDLRVAVRRTRAALGQIKGVLDAERVEPFRREFAWLGQATGPVRDLDVHLLELPQYREALPEASRAALDPLNESVVRQHAKEQKRLATCLRSRRYRRLIEDWRDFLANDGEDSGEAPRAAVPIGDLASTLIRRAHVKVMRIGESVLQGAPAAEMHRLRIQCKKLRYLMEFFRSLYDAKAIAEPIKTLKRLQDNLGAYNDLEVQSLWLDAFAKRRGESLGVDTLLAVGRLIEQLDRRQSHERDVFAGTFGTFSSSAVRKSFDRLFHAERRAS
ncbi:MAG: CHAD domain-containing protein, partial [bacterium]|nr:CHAD domain-containing protein [bacterium]